MNHTHYGNLICSLYILHVCTHTLLCKSLRPPTFLIINLVIDVLLFSALACQYKRANLRFATLIIAKKNIHSYRHFFRARRKQGFCRQSKSAEELWQVVQYVWNILPTGFRLFLYVSVLYVSTSTIHLSYYGHCTLILTDGLLINITSSALLAAR